MTNVSPEDLSNALNDVRWALEDQISDLKRYARDLEFRIDVLEDQVLVLRETLTAVILMTIGDERGERLAEQILRKEDP